MPAGDDFGEARLRQIEPPSWCNLWLWTLTRIAPQAGIVAGRTLGFRTGQSRWWRQRWFKRNRRNFASIHFFAHLSYIHSVETRAVSALHL